MLQWERALPRSVLVRRAAGTVLVSLAKSCAMYGTLETLAPQLPHARTVLEVRCERCVGPCRVPCPCDRQSTMRAQAAAELDPDDVTRKHASAALFALRDSMASLLDEPTAKRPLRVGLRL